MLRPKAPGLSPWTAFIFVPKGQGWEGGSGGWYLSEDGDAHTWILPSVGGNWCDTQSTRCAESLPRAEGTEELALFKLLLSSDSATDV